MGEGVCDSDSKCHMGKGGSKIGLESVTYYLNGPLQQNKTKQQTFI